LASRWLGVDKDNPTKSSPPDPLEGEKAFGNGTIKSWVSLDDNGNPNAIGVTLTEAALSNLPNNPFGVELALPQQASATAFNHVTFDWLAQAYEPEPIYGHPHFDVHFYTISQEERNAIAWGPDFLPVEAKYVPKDYAAPAVPFAVPRMGVHWGDSTATELHGEHFDKTMATASIEARWSLSSR